MSDHDPDKYTRLVEAMTPEQRAKFRSDGVAICIAMAAIGLGMAAIFGLIYVWMMGGSA